MILSFDTFRDEIHHRASRPLTSRLITIVTACKEYVFCCILVKFFFFFLFGYWFIVREVNILGIVGNACKAQRNPKGISTNAVAFMFPSSRCNSKLSTKLSLQSFFSPLFKLWRVGHLSLLCIKVLN